MCRSLFVEKDETIALQRTRTKRMAAHLYTRIGCPVSDLEIAKEAKLVAPPPDAPAQEGSALLLGLYLETLYIFCSAFSVRKDFQIHLGLTLIRGLP